MKIFINNVLNSTIPDTQQLLSLFRFISAVEQDQKKCCSCILLIRMIRKVENQRIKVDLSLWWWKELNLFRYAWVEGENHDHCFQAISTQCGQSKPSIKSQLYKQLAGRTFIGEKPASEQCKLLQRYKVTGYVGALLRGYLWVLLDILSVSQLYEHWIEQLAGRTFIAEGPALELCK